MHKRLVVVCKGVWDTYETLFRVELNYELNIMIKYNFYVLIDEYIILQCQLYIMWLS